MPVTRVSGPLTNTELRRSPVAVTGTVTATIGNVGVSNFPVTQTVDGTVDIGNFPATQPVSAVSLPLPSGAATSVSQAMLESLIDTLQELVQRLAPLGGSISLAAGQGLRVTPGGGTFAVSGPQTSAEFIAGHHVGGRNYPFAAALHNMAAQENINNVTAA